MQTHRPLQLAPGPTAQEDFARSAVDIGNGMVIYKGRPIDMRSGQQRLQQQLQQQSALGPLDNNLRIQLKEVLQGHRTEGAALREKGRCTIGKTPSRISQKGIHCCWRNADRSLSVCRSRIRKPSSKCCSKRAMDHGWLQTRSESCDES